MTILHVSQSGSPQEGGSTTSGDHTGISGSEVVGERAAATTAGRSVHIDEAFVSYAGRRGQGDVIAVDGISVSVPDGEFVSLVGPSGCGKTTLLMAVAGLKNLTSGQISVGGKQVKGPGMDRAVVFQDSGLFPWRTISGNIELGLETLRIPKARRREIARQQLALVGLSKFGKAYPHQLSGGMRQRVGIARALAVEPSVLLMDEPFAALDAQTRESLGDELLNIWERQRTTVLFVTHSIDEAIYLSDRVLVMTFRPGRIRADVRIDLPRPRGESVRSSARYSELRHQIWTEISEEVRKAEADALESVETDE